MEFSDSDKADAYLLIQLAGYAEAEFEYTPLIDPLTAEIGPIRGTVKISRINTGTERTYQAGHHTTWLRHFDSDLQSGVFETT